MIDEASFDIQVSPHITSIPSRTIATRLQYPLYFWVILTNFHILFRSLLISTQSDCLCKKNSWIQSLTTMRPRKSRAIVSNVRHSKVTRLPSSRHLV